MFLRLVPVTHSTWVREIVGGHHFELEKCIFQQMFYVLMLGDGGRSWWIVIALVASLQER